MAPDDIDDTINEMMSLLDRCSDMNMQLRDMRNMATDKRELRKICRKMDEAHNAMNEAFEILTRYANGI